MPDPASLPTVQDSPLVRDSILLPDRPKIRHISTTEEILPSRTCTYSSLQAQGSAPVIGDVVFHKRALFSVGDATGKVFTGDQPKDFPYHLEILTGEEWITRIYTDYLTHAEQSISPLEHAFNLNKIVNHQVRLLGLDPEESHLTPGIVSAIATWTAKRLEVAYWGDPPVIVELKDGSYVTSVNQVYQHDLEMRRKIKEIREDPLKPDLWKTFAPFLAEKRRERTNNLAHPQGYGILNGQANFPNCVHIITVPLQDVAKVFLSTDGMISFKESRLERDSVQALMSNLTTTDDLLNKLKNTRAHNLAEAAQTHIKFPEATALLAIPNAI